MSPKQAVLQIIEQMNLPHRLHADGPEMWERTYADIPYIPISHTIYMIDYHLSYFANVPGGICDISIVLYDEGQQIGLLPLSILGTLGAYQMTSNGQPIQPPVLAKTVAAKARKRIVAQCLELLHRLATALNISRWESAQSFVAAENPGLDDWHQRGMLDGAHAVLSHEMYVQLDQSITDYKRTLRKSYKALISSGNRQWNVLVLDKADPDTWTEYRVLHEQVAGRQTRSIATWDIQHQAISSGRAMLVYLRDDGGRMVGGGYFNLSRDEANYGVGAYDRTLFDRPLGHVVQYRAIEEMMARDIKWYKIGDRPFVGEIPMPNEKELSIAKFKQGFATHLMPRYRLVHTVAPATPTQQEGSPLQRR